LIANQQGYEAIKKNREVVRGKVDYIKYIPITNQNSINMVSELNATNCKTLFAEINGRKIAYRSIGNGDPIILCQRFRGNLDDWDPAFLDALSKNYNVITFDYTGFASSTGNPPTNMFLFAKDVVDLSKALNFKKIIVGGWSFGG